MWRSVGCGPCACRLVAPPAVTNTRKSEKKRRRPSALLAHWPCRPCLHGHFHGQSGPVPTSPITTATAVCATTANSTDHLHPRVALETLSCALHFFPISSCSRHSHEGAHSLRHSWTC